MLIIHHLNESRSQRVIWLAEELGLPYRIQHHSRGSDYLAPESLKRLHPLGKAPLVERDGQILAETGFIVETLARGTDLLAEGPAGDAVRYWLHYAEGSAMPPLVMKLVLSKVPDNAPRLMRPVARALVAGVHKAYLGRELDRHAAFWEQTLARSGWLAGDRLTAADVMMSFPVEMAALRSDLSTRPATRDWLTRIHARPAYVRALQAGGPYSGAAAG